MSRYTSAMIAGFAATVVLSILMVVKASMGLMPRLDVIHMLTQMMSTRLGLPATPIVGWGAHFVIGTVIWGVLFASLVNIIPGKTAVTKGMVFGAGAWVLMMLIPLPMAGAGLFGLSLGPMAPVMTLILHLIWGSVLGGIFQRLVSRARTN
ncbi:DUF6789 family protein [Halomonas elongata]|uniref:DUF6789 family protein n=1 Tax=Halomonas elongata TaxID=2746 RepID=UPI0023B015A8|nr:DUF6789 family protein [Halomonas elongata]